jgi:acetylglutamate kinase
MKAENVNLLREALPYINKFVDKVFVIKFGGEVADNPQRLFSFCEEVALCHRVGIKVSVVHGGGKQATELAHKLGIEAKIINGRRVTDEETLDIVKMVYAGKLNVDILLALRRSGVHAVGLSGVDGDLLTAKRRPPQIVKDDETGKRKKVDFGFVGDIVEVNPSIIRTLLEKEFVPVISSLAADDEGNVYNINADTIASSLAEALQAEKLILATDVDGILDGNGAPISRLTPGQAKQLIEKGVITGGMIPKVESAVRALHRHVKSIHVINGTKSGSLLEEIFTEQGAGTMIYDDVPARK